MTAFRLIIAGLLLAPLLSTPASSQALDPSFTPPTGMYMPGTVYALGPQQTDGGRLVAGIFSRVNNAPLSGMVRLDANGVVDQTFSQNIGTVSNVYRIRSLPTGQYLLGAFGGGVTAGGISRAELLRLNANGTADASFDTGSGPDGGGGYVQEYAVQPDGKVVVTGTFSTFNGVTAAGVARLNANGSVDTGFSVGTGFDVNSTTAYNAGYAVAVQADGKILVGGDFATFNGTTARGLVRLNSNGSVDATFVTPLQQQNSYVESIVLQPDGKILVSGAMYVGSTSPKGLVRLNSNGSLDTGFSAPGYTDGAVSTGQLDQPFLLQPDGKILAVGYFTGNGANHITRLNTNGAQDPTFSANGDLSSTPYTLGLQADGRILLGGQSALFTAIESPLGRLSATGSIDPTYTPKIQLTGSVSAMARQTDGKVVIGGNFTEISGQPVHRLARLATTGALDASYTAAVGSMPSNVSSLVLQPDGNLLVGTSRGVLRFLSSGSPDLNFSTPFQVFTSSLALQPDGKIMVAGSFSINFGGTTHNGLLRLNSNGQLDPTFVRAASTTLGVAGATDAVLVQPDGRIVVGGLFRPAGQPSVARVVRYESTGALDPNFNNTSAFTTTAGTSTTTNRVYALALQPDGRILAGGNFGAVDGTLHYSVARLTTSGAADLSFAPDALLTGSVNSLALQPNGRLLIGGSFSNSGPSSNNNNLARLLDNGQTDGSFSNAASPNSVVRSLVVQPNGAILLAGAFTNIGGQPAVGAGRITAANVLHVASPAVAARTGAWPVPARTELHVAPDQSAHPLTVELLDALGRRVLVQAASTPELTLRVENLPAGLYLLRVNYAAGAVTRQLTIE